LQALFELFFNFFQKNFNFFKNFLRPRGRVPEGKSATNCRQALKTKRPGTKKFNRAGLSPGVVTHQCF
jgi:hypothetical protein